MNVPLVNLKRQYASIKEEIDNAIQEILDNTSFIMGKPVEDFEKEFAEYCGAKHCIGVSSGTDALLLVYSALGIKKGDEIIAPSHTFFATIEPAVMLGAKPVFVDVNEKTLNIDASKIEEKISAKTKAIVPVHIYGQPADMTAVSEIAEKHSIPVVEDCCQAHGAEFNGKKVPIGKTGVFSFYPGKNLGAYGDAGAVVTNDKEIAENISVMRNHGRASKYSHDYFGYNARLDALQAAVLSVKLNHLEDWNNKRIENAKIYSEELGNAEIGLPFTDERCKHVFHLYTVRVKERDRVLAELKENGIRAGVHYPEPLHLQKPVVEKGFAGESLPVTEKACKELISLPMFAELTEEEIGFVCKTLKESVKK